MISKGFAVIGVLMLLSATAHAGSAPKELCGKSIAVKWSESITGRNGGDQTTRNWLNAHSMDIYISGAGRPFVQLLSGHAQGTRGSPSLTAPGQSNVRVDFEGRSIFVFTAYVSGLRRIAVDLEGAGACKATVINGRQAGTNIVRQSAGRGLGEISSIQVSDVSCSIREGNIFGQ
jgi:hypothetical protein